MIKICYLLLTLSSGDPTLINFNDVAAVTQGGNAFGFSENKLYFLNASAFGAGSITVKETAIEIAEKLEQCKPISTADPRFVFVGK